MYIQNYNEIRWKCIENTPYEYSKTERVIVQTDKGKIKKNDNGKNKNKTQ